MFVVIALPPACLFIHLFFITNAQWSAGGILASEIIFTVRSSCQICDSFILHVNVTLKSRLAACDIHFKCVKVIGFLTNSFKKA